VFPGEELVVEKAVHLVIARKQRGRERDWRLIVIMEGIS
jgi:hypothetical protein